MPSIRPDPGIESPNKDHSASERRRLSVWEEAMAKAKDELTAEQVARLNEPGLHRVSCRGTAPRDRQAICGRYGPFILRPILVSHAEWEPDRRVCHLCTPSNKLEFRLRR